MSMLVFLVNMQALFGVAVFPWLFVSLPPSYPCYDADSGGTGARVSLALDDEERVYCTLLHAHPAVPRLSNDSGGLSEAVSLGYLKTRLFVSPSTCTYRFPILFQLVGSCRIVESVVIYPDDDPSWLLQRGGG